MGGLTAEAVALLDRPAWSSLTTAHADLAQGDDRALRYQPEVNVFVSPVDHGAEALAAAAALVTPGDRAYIVQAEPAPELPGLTAVLRSPLVQMVFEGPVPAREVDEEITRLAEGDADEMLALAILQQPGPFRRETRRMGRFVGVKRDGRLAAMAGERFHFPGFCELSGVCTHPDFGGEGLGTRLSTHVTRAILDRGETPFLHAWSDNYGAIALYERLGYRIRRELNVAIFERS
ncbi:MAG TPA: GNAT family N-acetyltransferase [Croceibacterium sp.]|nr:GNAT family N-acetyltransferase [Croceibacterium sp.]